MADPKRRKLQTINAIIGSEHGDLYEVQHSMGANFKVRTGHSQASSSAQLKEAAKVKGFSAP
jgi:hypothetical protein